ncbi:orotate phosphoribosyltransferase-like protein [Methanoregula formicica]|uniref:Transcriptional regulator GfcR n=1 Tax=Methanoregula formicica (strain DSM 22288 / NBRC 105244 / SMSP) TaxID=593750 RepID=L0HBH4_METFS|nr:orotate phosphoribosyltransferase-like protein [Methanoregula formicica]AGB01370.1 orotate phosphoribosyltransferase-like enzyme [Methanoregula formicica SMSP]
MSSLDDLIGKAKVLLSEGHSPGQIADELSLSMETVTWLLTQAKGTSAPKDVHIDWTAVSSHAPMLEETAIMLLNRYYQSQKETTAGSPVADVIVGIALSGIPLATLIAVQEAAQLAIYHPAKQSQSERPTGSISGNFAPVTGQRCIIVDDVITSGNTMKEVVRYLKKHNATPVAIWVIFDKRGIRDIDGVPVCSLYKVSPV